MRNQCYLSCYFGESKHRRYPGMSNTAGPPKNELSPLMEFSASYLLLYSTFSQNFQKPQLSKFLSKLQTPTSPPFGLHLAATQIFSFSLSVDHHSPLFPLAVCSLFHPTLYPILISFDPFLLATHQVFPG